MGKTWVYSYTLALAKELLGLVRSKFSQVPIPGSTLQLNGTDLITQGRDDQGKLKDEMKELLESLTYEKMLEGDANKAESLQRLLKTIPIPMGKAIIIG
jgi:hypothetical protein